ncbi:MAG: excinuclease ABC subunit UvrC [Kiritimatiellae bacterium]|nr:excinuclease ABC subunit UvrC [Kiritimatiellia bacterium]
MNVSDKVKKKLLDIPDKPGCYIMRDRKGKIIYVGKAKSLRKRVQSYFRQASFHKAPPKLRSLINTIYDLDYIVLKSEAEALLTESRLIKEYKPKYNVDFKDDKRFILIKAERQKKYPILSLARIRKNDGAEYFGPFISSPAAKATRDFLEKRFGIRRCSPAEPDENTYKHCMNDIIRHCSAPCINKVSIQEYRDLFEEACAFLRGERPAVMKELWDEMQVFSESKDYERAAAIRDTYLHLKRVIKQRGRIVADPNMKKSDALEGLAELQTELNLPTRPLVIEGFDISNIMGIFAVASMVVSIDGLPAKNRYRRFRIKTIEGIDDPAMIGEAVYRRYSRLKEEGGKMPDLIMIDGGITQLGSAISKIKELGLSIPVISLAKRYEEVYFNPKLPPHVFDTNANALKVLQRLRDEAHRFAITYHRTLREKQIKNSVLDDIEGIGEKRKELLLKHFGSVTKLKKASVEEIASVPGFAMKSAELVKDFLRRAN